MSDESESSPPPENFPQYAPPNPTGLVHYEARQQKPLLKLLAKRLHPKIKPRVSPVKKRLGKRKKDGQRWLE